MDDIDNTQEQENLEDCNDDDFPISPISDYEQREIMNDLQQSFNNNDVY